jgi:D-amino-acid oxidase
MGWFTKLGGEIESGREVKDLGEVARRYPLVVNCTGIWAKKLCEGGAGEEKFTAKRGQVVIIRKRADIGRCLVHLGRDEKGGDVLTYIIPRRDDCLLGGTSEPGVWELAPSEDVAEAILERCKALEPSLRNLKPEDILGHKVGLRPARKKVRLKRRGRVIHNYGHGGDGFTLSWGCAEDVVKLALKYFT